MLEKIKSSFSTWTKFDYIWLIIANSIILGLSLYWGDGLIPIMSAMSGITCVIFVSKQMIANYYFGIINVALYAFLAFQARLYGDFMLNAFFYFPIQFVGIYMWTRSKKKSHTEKVEVKILSNKARLVIAVLTISIVIGYGLVLKRIGGNIPFVDSTSTVLSIVAQVLMLCLYVEQWYLWVLVNIVSVIMWGVSLSQGVGDFSTLLMWILYLANSLYGLYNWRKASKNK